VSGYFTKIFTKYMTVALYYWHCQNTRIENIQLEGSDKKKKKKQAYI